MDIEQLKLILDVLGAAGAGSKEMFYIFMAADMLKTAVITCIVLFVVYHAVKILSKLVSDNSESDKLRRAAGVGYQWSENELDLACAILKQHFKEEARKQGGVR